jgi:tripartite-type tricarboxylate transporter receptor subunit TctC
MGNLSMESFKLAAGIDLLHVPYKGAAPSVLNLVGGHVQAAVLALPPLLPQIRDGKVRALAVTSPKRSPTVPDVPTIEQAGFPQARADNWFGVLVPKVTPKNTVGRLHDVLTRSLTHPETRAYLDKQGAEIIASQPEQFAELLRSEYVKWEKVIHKTGIKAE